MNTLTITLDDKAFDGLIEAGSRNGSTAEAIATEMLTNQGNSYADLFSIGQITSAAFVTRFKPEEYAAIVAAAEASPEVAGYIAALIQRPYVPMTDPRLQGAVEALADAGLIAPERVAEITAYERPVPVGK